MLRGQESLEDSSPAHVRAWVCTLAVFASLLLVARIAFPRELSEKNVLLMYSHEREMASYADLDSGLRSTLETAPTTHLQFYTEYLDLIRFPNYRHRQTLVNYLRLKYSDQRIDLIIVIGPPALDFLIESGDGLFPEVPIVFASVNTDGLKARRLKSNITGVAIKRRIADTLDVALKLQPDTNLVVVPVGAGPVETGWATDLRNALRQYEQRVEITYLANLSMDETLRRLANLPPHSVVLFSTIIYDALGHYYVPDALDLICRSSSAPVYSTIESDLGRGIVGGRLYDLAAAGRAAGQQAQRVLAGEVPADISIQELDLSHDMFDARQLRRWGISETQLPPASIVRYNPPSVWELGKQYILVAAALLTIQFCMIAALVAETRRRRRSESLLDTLSGHFMNALDDERKRIASELHDDFGQRLALIKIALDTLARECAGETDKNVLRLRLRHVGANVRRLASDIHHLSHRLHSPSLECLGLQSALRELCADANKLQGLVVEARIEAISRQVPREVALCFYRVAQEALHNVSKHSGAGSVVVALSCNDTMLKMRIVDSGNGFDPRVGSKGVGLASMRERLRRIGGQLLIDSRPGNGTTITAQIVLRQSTESALREPTDERRAWNYPTSVSNTR
jgi:signal transduction histidine kinase